jgi:hypothetical protein
VKQLHRESFHFCSKDIRRTVPTRLCWPYGRFAGFTDLVKLQSKLGHNPCERPAPREEPRHHAP